MKRYSRGELNFKMHADLEALAQEKGWRVELVNRKPRRKANPVQKEERLRKAFVTKLAKKYGGFLHEANAKRLKQSSLMVVQFLPPEVLEKLGRVFGLHKNNIATIAQMLAQRVVFIPEKEFHALSLLFYGKAGREPPACAAYGYAFLSTQRRRREFTFYDSVHELTHVVNGLVGVPVGSVKNEVLAVCLSMFARYHKPGRQRSASLRSGVTEYRAWGDDSEDYVKSVNFGRAAFMQAQEIETLFGLPPVKRFFSSLYKLPDLNKGTIAFAAQSARQEARKLKV